MNEFTRSSGGFDGASRPKLGARKLSRSGRESPRQSVRRPVLMRLSFKTVRPLPLPSPAANSSRGRLSTPGTWREAPERLFSRRRRHGRSAFRSPSALVKSSGRTLAGYFVSRGICSPRMQRFPRAVSVAKRSRDRETPTILFSFFFFFRVFLVLSKFLESFFINVSEFPLFKIFHRKL